MDVRRTLVLRLYRSQIAVTGAVGVCEDPQTGNQQPFGNAAQLWSIVERALDAEKHPVRQFDRDGEPKP